MPTELRVVLWIVTWSACVVCVYYTVRYMKIYRRIVKRLDTMEKK